LLLLSQVAGQAMYIVHVSIKFQSCWICLNCFYLNWFRATSFQEFNFKLMATDKNWKREQIARLLLLCFEFAAWVTKSGKKESRAHQNKISKVRTNINLSFLHEFHVNVVEREASYVPHIWININWRDVQTKNVANNVDMSCLRTPWQNGPYKH